jgi:ribosomal protein S18 acetylase RimI-like enzyme
MTELYFSKVGINEIVQLQEISKSTFKETFQAHNNEADLQKYLDNDLSVKRLTEELNTMDSEFYFAKLNDIIIGYIKVNFGVSKNESIAESSFEIERIYLLNEFQSKGFGQKLFDWAKEIAIVKNARVLWLGVWEHNTKAIEFYKKNGLKEFGKHIFRLGDDDQIDLLMRKNIGVS